MNFYWLSFNYCIHSRRKLHSLQVDIRLRHVLIDVQHIHGQIYVRVNGRLVYTDLHVFFCGRETHFIILGH